ncbi:hypothetical protein BT63DRAFT_478289 [Microthyrium microscopicum]|uniref:Uncharacterized protein n=1 Tax=Microthyrium microscopicum TaxID=703497 RepID=A0A6A6UEM1_9PEZI|nr:hypothetical protein BT63DRAFT_478289 [Microthyrium microscopicum]
MLKSSKDVLENKEAKFANDMHQANRKLDEAEKNIKKVEIRLSLATKTAEELFEENKTLKAERERAAQDLSEKHKAELAQQKQFALESLRLKLDEQRLDLQGKTWTNLEAVRKVHAQEVEALKHDHDQWIQELGGKHQAEMSQQKDRLEQNLRHDIETQRLELEGKFASERETFREQLDQVQQELEGSKNKIVQIQGDAEKQLSQEREQSRLEKANLKKKCEEIEAKAKAFLDSQMGRLHEHRQEFTTQQSESQNILRNSQHREVSGGSQLESIERHSRGVQRSPRPHSQAMTRRFVESVDIENRMDPRRRNTQVPHGSHTLSDVGKKALSHLRPPTAEEMLYGGKGVQNKPSSELSTISYKATPPDLVQRRGTVKVTGPAYGQQSTSHREEAENLMLPPDRLFAPLRVSANPFLGNDVYRSISPPAGLETVDDRGKTIASFDIYKHKNHIPRSSVPPSSRGSIGGESVLVEKAHRRQSTVLVEETQNEDEFGEPIIPGRARLINEGSHLSRIEETQLSSPYNSYSGRTMAQTSPAQRSEVEALNDLAGDILAMIPDTSEEATQKEDRPRIFRSGTTKRHAETDADDAPHPKRISLIVRPPATPSTSTGRAKSKAPIDIESGLSSQDRRVMTRSKSVRGAHAQNDKHSEHRPSSRMPVVESKAIKRGSKKYGSGTAMKDRFARELQ